MSLDLPVNIWSKLHVLVIWLLEETLPEWKGTILPFNHCCHFRNIKNRAVRKTERFCSSEVQSAGSKVDQILSTASSQFSIALRHDSFYLGLVRGILLKQCLFPLILKPISPVSLETSVNCISCPSSWEVCRLSFTPMDLFHPKPWPGHKGSSDLQDMSGTAWHKSLKEVSRDVDRILKFPHPKGLHKPFEQL